MSYTNVDNGQPVLPVGVVQSTDFLGRDPRKGYNGSSSRWPAAMAAVDSSITVGQFIGRDLTLDNLNQVTSLDQIDSPTIANVVGATPRNAINGYPQPITVANVAINGFVPAGYNQAVSIYQEGVLYIGCCDTISAAAIQGTLHIATVNFGLDTDTPIYAGMLVAAGTTDAAPLALTGVASLSAFAGDVTGGYVWGDVVPVQFNFINS